MAYGRNVTAQQGTSIQYDRGRPANARSYLEPQESAEYDKHLATMRADRAGKGTGRNTWSGSRQHVSKLLRLDNAMRTKADKKFTALRSVAGERALGEFSSQAMTTSKPWLNYKQNNALLQGENVSSPLDANKLYWTRQKGPGAKDRMTKNQKARVGDIAKYTNFNFDPVGMSGKATRGRQAHLDVPPPADLGTPPAPTAPPVNGTQTGGGPGGAETPAPTSPAGLRPSTVSSIRTSRG